MTNCFISVHAQVVSSVNTEADSVTIGDPIIITLKIKLPLDARLKSLDFSVYKRVKNENYALDTTTMEPIGDVEILDFGQWKHAESEEMVPSEKIKIATENGQQVIQNQFRIAIYNPGLYFLPAPVASVEAKDTTMIIGQSPKVTVVLPSTMMNRDTLALNPIRDIVREEANISDYLTYVYIILGLALMAAVAYYFYRLKKQKQRIPVEEKPVIVPPHIKALEALRLLENEQVWQKGMIKEYQSRLTDIIRTYLEDRYQISAMEMTSFEIQESLEKVNFERKYNDDLTYILQIADLVKFAKATPEGSIHADFMAKAVAFVENTKETTAEL
jgi:hypothetical protein